MESWDSDVVRQNPSLGRSSGSQTRVEDGTQRALSDEPIGSAFEASVAEKQVVENRRIGRHPMARERLGRLVGRRKRSGGVAPEPRTLFRRPLRRRRSSADRGRPGRRFFLRHEEGIESSASASEGFVEERAPPGAVCDRSTCCIRVDLSSRLSIERRRDDLQDGVGRRRFDRLKFRTAVQGDQMPNRVAAFRVAGFTRLVLHDDLGCDADPLASGWVNRRSYIERTHLGGPDADVRPGIALDVLDLAP